MIYRAKTEEELGYWNLSGLEDVYFEDSWVLEIIKTEDQIQFLLELILTEAHPFYEKLLPNERYCYKRATLVFKNVKRWLKFKQSNSKYVDPDGSVDFGNIDVFEVRAKDLYFLMGDWGELKVISDKPILEFDLEVDL